MSAKEFLVKSLKKLVKKHPDMVIKYTYDDFDKDHFVSVGPKWAYDLILHGEATRIDEEFIGKFPYDSLSFIEINHKPDFDEVVWEYSPTKAKVQKEFVEEEYCYYSDLPSVQFYSNIEQEKSMYEKLKDYFENTPKEQIEKDWKETEKYDEVGPTVKEFIGMSTLDLDKIEERIDKMLEEDKVEIYTGGRVVGKESYTIRTIRNRNKYRFRLRMYKRLWMYALLFIDYLKERIYYYENKGIEDKDKPKWALDKKNKL